MEAAMYASEPEGGMQGSEWIIESSELILVTGANGFVGSKVVEVLQEYGFTNIRCFVRSLNAPRVAALSARASAAQVEFFEGNLLSPQDCERAVRGAAIIVHLAAGTGKSFADCFMNSAVATRNLLDAARRVTDLKRFVNVSSLSVHSGADMRRGALLDETSPIETRHMERFDAYSYGKIKQDELVIRYGREFRLPYTILRPGLVYGPGKKAIPGRVGIDTFGIFLHLGGRNRLPLIFVDNCAEAVVRTSLARGIDGEVFIAVDDELPRSVDFLRLFKKNVRRMASIRVPYRVFYLLNVIWERYSKRSGGQLPPVFNRRICATYYQSQRYSNRKLKEGTGWRPRVSFKEASRRYFDFMRGGVSE
jgi:nucleoside-diphosphate-sugar epimerase